MAYGHIHGNMLAEVEGFPDAMRLVDLIVETVWCVGQVVGVAARHDEARAAETTRRAVTLQTTAFSCRRALVSPLPSVVSLAPPQQMLQ